MVLSGAVYLFYTLLYLGPFAEYGNPFSQWLGVIMTVDSFALALLVRRYMRSTRTIEALAVVFELLLAFAVSLTQYLALPAEGYDAPLNTISWSCVIVIIFPFLVPMRWGKSAVAALAAATANPLALGVAHLAVPLPHLPPHVLASLIAPPFLCALMAIIPARVLARLDRAVTAARQLGAYELLEQLGQGGMGEVWRARHRLLARPAAVKLLRADLLGPDGSRGQEVLFERFEREAQATASLESAHTVELYDFGVAEGGVLYYAMELVRGIDLDAMVRRYGPLPPGRVVHLLCQACDSLDEAHQVGLVHRDIKPSNLMVGRRARQVDFLRVLDFGLVKRRDAPKDVRLTLDGTLHGTPAFLAPEMVTGDFPVGPQADVYALGCVAYWLLAAALPFDAADPLQMALAHVTKAPVALSQRTELEIPPDLERVVMGCLAKIPVERPAGAAGLRAELEACGGVGSWTQADARRWWEAHDPEVLGPAAAECDTLDIRRATLGEGS